MKKIMFISVFALANCKADSATLYTIANGDPIEWGDAVYSAQVMLGIYPTPSNPLREMQEGDEETIADEGFVYPNPAKDEITIDYPLEVSASVEFYSSLGQQVVVENLEVGDIHVIDISKLPNGIYFYSIKQNDEAILTGKFSILK